MGAGVDVIEPGVNLAWLQRDVRAAYDDGF